MSGEIVYRDPYPDSNFKPVVKGDSGSVVVRKTQELDNAKVVHLDPYKDSVYEEVAKGDSGAVLIKRKEPRKNS
ncbi:MAG: hypothetical protein ACOYET_07470, partial [Bacillota bacterium]|jgi:hypothetical protein